MDDFAFFLKTRIIYFVLLDTMGTYNRSVVQNYSTYSYSIAHIVISTQTTYISIIMILYFTKSYRLKSWAPAEGYNLKTIKISANFFSSHRS